MAGPQQQPQKQRPTAKPAPPRSSAPSAATAPAASSAPVAWPPQRKAAGVVFGAAGVTRLRP